MVAVALDSYLYPNKVINLEGTGPVPNRHCQPIKYNDLSDDELQELFPRTVDSDGGMIYYVQIAFSLTLT